jgi:hypothetical protein
MSGALAGVTLGGCNAQDANAVQTNWNLQQLELRVSDLESNVLYQGQTYVDNSPSFCGDEIVMYRPIDTSLLF